MSDGRVFVAKINKTRSLNDEAREEAEKLMAMDHPNIVKCVDGFLQKFESGIYYVAILEYCTGGDL